MPEAIGENIPVEFTCLCCHQPVQIWAFVPVHPDTSNTKLLPEQWRRPYRQLWYRNDHDNAIFDNGQLWQVDPAGFQPTLVAVSLQYDGNPYVSDLPRILPAGMGRGKIFWTCPPCTKMSDRDRTMLWYYILATLYPPSLV